MEERKSSNISIDLNCSYRQYSNKLNDSVKNVLSKSSLK